MNHFIRDEGDWYIQVEDIKLKHHDSASLEVAYQMGLSDAIAASKKINKSIHLKLAEYYLKESEKFFNECDNILDNLETNLKTQCKPSEALEKYWEG